MNFANDLLVKKVSYIHFKSSDQLLLATENNRIGNPFKPKIIRTHWKGSLNFNVLIKENCVLNQWITFSCSYY